jgi:hypothetical protein
VVKQKDRAVNQAAKTSTKGKAMALKCIHEVVKSFWHRACLLVRETNPVRRNQAERFPVTESSEAVQSFQSDIFVASSLPGTPDYA